MIISHGHNYLEVSWDEYEETYSEQGWALLTDQEYGRQALEYLVARDAAEDPEEFARQALEYKQAVEQQDA